MGCFWFYLSINDVVFAVYYLYLLYPEREGNDGNDSFLLVPTEAVVADDTGAIGCCCCCGWLANNCLFDRLPDEESVAAGAVDRNR